MTYHCIDNSVFGSPDLFVPVSRFESQLKYLKDAGYNSINFSDLDNLANINKPIIISIDDGYEDNYKNAYPLLKKYKFKATIFLVAGYIGKPSILKKNQILAMEDLIDFQCHTMTHPRLSTITENWHLAYELKQSKDELEALLGKKITVLAYPYGNFNQSTIDFAKKYYKYAVTTNKGVFYSDVANDYAIRRITVSRNLTLAEFKMALTH